MKIFLGFSAIFLLGLLCVISIIPMYSAYKERIAFEEVHGTPAESCYPHIEY